MDETIEIEESSGNVFADLGFPNPEEHLLKAELALQIGKAISRHCYTQTEAAARMGIDQPKVSKLIRGHLRDFSVDRLLRFLNALDQDIEIVIREKPKTRKKATLTVSQVSL
jgi:predicted XRE-type DNA-binding protein